MHGCLEIWNFSSRVQLAGYLACSLRSRVRNREEHSKRNSIPPHVHVLFFSYFMSTEIYPQYYVDACSLISKFNTNNYYSL